jgi:hypothetical protein
MTLDTMLKMFCRRVSLNGKDLKQDRVSVGVANSEPAIVTQGSGAMGAAKAPATRKRTNWRNMKVSPRTIKILYKWELGKAFLYILNDDGNGICIWRAERHSLLTG